MITKRLLLTSAAGLLAAPFINNIASASTRWHMAISVPETSFTGRVVREFVDEIHHETNNELNITIHSRSSLAPESQVLRGIRSGQLQAGMFLGALHGNEDPFFEVEGIPFLANSWDETRALRAAAEPYVRERLVRRNATELYSINWPSQGIFSQVPVQSVADLRDLRFRVYNRMTVRMATLAGTRPVNICCNPAETSLAFASGMAEAMFTSAQSGVDSQAWDYVKYFTDVGGMRNRTLIVANTPAYNRLSADIKRVIARAGENANRRGFEVSKQVEVETVETLRSRGIQTYTASERLMSELREIGAQLAREWLASAGPEGPVFMGRYQELLRARS